MRTATLNTAKMAAAIILGSLFDIELTVGAACPTPSFAAPATILPTSNNAAFFSPYAAAAGDLNGDGKLDLAVAGSDGVWVFSGNRDGTFRPPTKAFGGQASSVAVGDFNSDGKPDLALVNGVLANGSGVSVLLGNGDGTFNTPIGNYDAGNLPYALAVGDFNRDGQLDLAVANYGGSNNNVTVILGNGDGTFQSAADYNVGQNLTSIAAGDFSGNGKLDLAVANQNRNNVAVLLGNGDGTFKPVVNYRTGAEPVFVAAGDFNGDGKLDLAVSNYEPGNPTNGSVSVLLGNGDGTFQPPVNYGVSANAMSVAVGDFNGDGKLDLVVGTVANIAVLLGNGDGTFQRPITYGGSGDFVGVADFRGNGKSDLVVTMMGGGFLFPVNGSASVRLNTCPCAGVRLDVTRSNNAVIVSWPLPYTNFIPESAPSFGSGNWEQVAQMITTSNGRCEVTVPLDQQLRFFRLRKP